MRVLVCGGRDFSDWAKLSKTLHDMFIVYDETPFPHLPEGFVLIQGGAKGADSLADQWSHLYGVASLEFKADWKTHGKAAGPIRNQQMLDQGSPDLVIAFPGGRGTADMVQRSKAAGIEVREIVSD